MRQNLTKRFQRNEFSRVLLAAALLFGANAATAQQPQIPEEFDDLPLKLRQRPLAPEVRPKIPIPAGAKLAHDTDGDLLPYGALQRFGSARLRHENVTSLAFSPDGRWLVSAGGGSLRTWNVATGRLLCQRELAIAAVQSVQFPTGETPFGRPPGRTVLVVNGTTAGLWDPLADTETVLPPHRVRHEIGIVAFAANGQTAAIATGLPGGEEKEGVAFWNLPSGRTWRFRGSSKIRFNNFALSPDGRSFVARTSSKGLSIVDALTGTINQTIPNSSDDFPRKIVFSPDGRYLVFANAVDADNPVGDDDEVTVWDIAQGKMAALWRGFKYKHSDAAFTADCRYVVFASLHAIEVIDFARGQIVRRWNNPCPNSESVAMAVSPDGRTIAAAGQDGVIRFCDFVSGKIRRPPVGISGGAIVPAISPDGRTLAIAGEANGEIFIWDTATCRMLPSLAGHHDAVAYLQFLPDGSRLVSADSQDIRVWDWRNGKATQIIKPKVQPNAVGNDLLAEMALDPSRREIVIVSNWTSPSNAVNSRVRAYDWQTGAERLERNYRNSGIGGMALSQQGIRLAQATQYPENPMAKLTVEDARTGRRLQSFSTSMSLDQFSPDGRILVMTERKAKPAVRSKKPNEDKQFSIQLWDAILGKSIATLPAMIGSPTTTFSPNGRLLVLSDERTLQIFDVPSGRLLACWSEGRSRSTEMTFSAEARTLFTGHENGTVLSWDLSLLLPKNELPKDALTAAVQNQLWADLLAQPPVAYAAVDRLAAHPTDAIALIRTRWRPMPGPSDAEIRRWCDDLGSRSFRQREIAQEKLSAHLDTVESQLEATIKTGSPEARRRATAILGEQAPIPTGEGLRAIRAIQILERIGTADARRLAETISRESTGRVADEAQATVRRMPR